MPEYGTFKATETERVPSAYYVPPGLTNAIDRLRAHGIAMTPLKAAQTVPIEEFRIEATELARAIPGSQGAQHHRHLDDGRARAPCRHAADRSQAAAGAPRLLFARATVRRRAARLELAGRCAGSRREGVSDRADAELMAGLRSRSAVRGASGSETCSRECFQNLLAGPGRQQPHRVLDQERLSRVWSCAPGGAPR